MVRGRDGARRGQTTRTEKWSFGVMKDKSVEAFHEVIEGKVV